MMLLLLKIIGLVIAAGGGWLALRGNTTENGAFTRDGKRALCLLIAGFGVSIATELVAAYESSASARWDSAKTLPLTVVSYRFSTLKATTAGDLCNALNRMRIWYGFQTNEGEVHGRSIRCTFDPEVANVEAATTLQLVSEDRVIGAGKTTLIRRVSDGWTTSVSHDWTNKELKRHVGGISARILWRGHQFPANITSVEHLNRLSYLAIMVPDSAYLDQFAEAKMTFFTVGEPLFILDLKSLPYHAFEDRTSSPPFTGRSAWLDGEDLLRLWEEYN